MPSLTDVIRALRPEESPSGAQTSDPGVAFLRCPHTDQPLLDVSWFRSQCSRCNQPVQVPKRSFDELVGRHQKVSIICFECWNNGEEPANV